MAARMGLNATGIDAAPAAIAIAERKARERGLTARFLVHNALELASLDEGFDTVLDCGLFHVFEDDDRARFVESLRAVIPGGGRYYVLCFSDRQPGDWGPCRVTQEEITANFTDGWRIDAIDGARIDITIDPNGARAGVPPLPGPDTSGGRLRRDDRGTRKVLADRAAREVETTAGRAHVKFRYPPDILIPVPA